MAQKVSVIFVADISGEKADETVKFGLAGAGYEIDLSLQNSQELRSSASPNVRHA